MASNTYVALQTVTISGSSTSTVTFSAIPPTYTDLVIVEQSTGSVAAYSAVYFNGDNASTNYSWTYMFGTGSSAVSGRVSNLNRFETSYHSTSATPNTMIFNIMNYANTTTYKTMLQRYNLSNDGVGAYVGLWRKTPEAITSVTFANLSGTYTAGSTFTIYGIAAATPLTAKATGGTIYYGVDGYVYHKFISSGTFTPTTSLTADVLTIAGGGGGGNLSGGGGAGGLLYSPSQSLTATGYSITVGGGGAGGVGFSGQAASGANSSFASLVATGGGGGGRAYINGVNGGSGGGAGIFASTGGTGVSGQGYAGGTGTTGFDAGGGGGAGAIGGAGTQSPSRKSGNGGIGSSTYSDWGVATSSGHNVSGTYYYAGGGGGGGSVENSLAVGLGGYGGGADGRNNTTGNSATSNTGGGGGGGGQVSGVTYNGGAGGSGIVIVRYLG